MSETATLDRPDPAVVDAVQAGFPVVEPSSGPAAREGRTRVERAVRGQRGGGR